MGIIYQNEQAVLEHLKVVKEYDVVTTVATTFRGTPTQAQRHAREIFAQKGVVAVDVYSK